MNFNFLTHGFPVCGAFLPRRSVTRFNFPRRRKYHGQATTLSAARGLSRCPAVLTPHLRTNLALSFLIGREGGEGAELIERKQS